MHESHALCGGEVHGAQAGHGESGSDAGGCVLALRLDEYERAAGNVHVTLGFLLRPVFAHLRGWRDRVGAGGIARLALAHDDGTVAIQCSPLARILENMFWRRHCRYLTSRNNSLVTRFTPVSEAVAVPDAESFAPPHPSWCRVFRPTRRSRPWDNARLRLAPPAGYWRNQRSRGYS